MFESEQKIEAATLHVYRLQPLIDPPPPDGFTSEDDFFDGAFVASEEANEAPSRETSSEANPFGGWCFDEKPQLEGDWVNFLKEVSH